MDAPRKLLVDTVAQRPDLDLKKLSLSIGRNHAYLQQFLMRGSPRELPEGARHALAPLLGIAPDDLRSYASPSVGGGRLEAELRAPSAQRAAAERADLPVYASSEGNAGIIAVTSEPIVFVRRPEPLTAVRDGYGCYMIGDSMSPAYEQGDLLLIHPGKPVRPGDDCLFIREHSEAAGDAAPPGAQYAQVRRLLRSTPEKFRVRQFNAARDFDLDRGQWSKVQLIVGKYSR